jgi:hypothetical protein
MTAAHVALLALVGSPFAAAFVVGVLLLRRWVRLIYGRDVMDRFRPDRRKVAATDRALDDIHYDVVVGS